MLGARLARRIVPPLLLAVAVLFAVLAAVALSIADARVQEEMADTADRIAATLDRIRPERRSPNAIELPSPIVREMARLMDVDIAVDGFTTAESLQGMRVLERPLRTGECQILFSKDRISSRRADVLWPIALTGAGGLLVALILGLVIARAIARPVRHLADSVQGFARGEFQGDVGARGPGEIGALQDAFVRMVAEIRAAEDRLRESERMAALGRLAGGIAHELRNPLTAVRMAVESTEHSEARTISLAEIDRLDRTLRELLDFVRPRAPRKKATKPAELARDVATLLGPQCRHLGVELVLDVKEAEDANASWSVDPDRVKQAAINLVLNAAQAQPEGGRVTLRATAESLEVADEGPGISADLRETLFQPFVTTKTAGIGLGLAVVKQVADEHGAELVLETSPAGTMFRLRFGDPERSSRG